MSISNLSKIESPDLRKETARAQALYEQHKHKPIRVMGPMDYSARFIPVPKRTRAKPIPQRVLDGRKERAKRAENLQRCIDWLRTNGPATSEQVAEALGLDVRSVSVSLGVCRGVKATSDLAYTQRKDGRRYRISVWAVAA